jgi:hypothetical protein
MGTRAPDPDCGADRCALNRAVKRGFRVLRRGAGAH